MTLRVRKIPFRNHLTRSAVAIVYRIADQQVELLLIKRATREGDPWSGHMAFPGGKLQADDCNAKAAAIRETREELNLDLIQCAQYEARLSDLVTRRHNSLRPMVVTPFLFRLNSETLIEPNHEVQSSVWVPLSFFKDTSNQTTMIWHVGPMKLKLPCYDYQGNRIWGLTLMMLKEILKLDLFR